MPEDFDYSASITSMDVRETFPSIDPENLSERDVLAILLYLFEKKADFVEQSRNGLGQCLSVSPQIHNRHKRDGRLHCGDCGFKHGQDG